MLDSFTRPLGRFGTSSLQLVSIRLSSPRDHPQGGCLAVFRGTVHAISSPDWEGGGESMLMAADTKVLVVHRRLFEKDHSRYFVGRVQGYEDGVAKITGRSFARDQYGAVHRKEDERTKIVSLSSGTLMVYQLPESVDLDALELYVDGSAGVTLRDDNGFKMDLTEIPHS
jgi:hypothetical protein